MQAALRLRARAMPEWLIGADLRQRETKVRGALRKLARVGSLEIFKRSRRVARYLQIIPAALRGYLSGQQADVVQTDIDSVSHPGPL
jgi:hypothetical protein